MNKARWWAILGSCAVISLGVAACGDDEKDSTGADTPSTGATGATGDAPSDLSGTIRIDGSSTVGPLTEAVAEAFHAEFSGVDVKVGQAGTGGGFEKFCAGETDINDASRQIEPDEVAACEKAGVTQTEVTVANDALTVVVNPNNPNECATIEQLAAIWGPDDTAGNWNEVDGLDDGFDAEIQRFGPGTDSGTFDYFTEAINGEEGVQTKDYNNVGEDDNQTVFGVQGSEGGIGYFGFSYFQANAGGLKALQVDNGEGCVAPEEATVQDGSYAPLGRALYIYPSAEALKKPEVKAFVDFYLANVNDIASGIGFIGLTDEQRTASQAAVDKLG